MTEQNLFRKIEKSLKDRVEYILENYPKARNDKYLLINWFYVEYYNKYLEKTIENGITDYKISLKNRKYIPDDEQILRARRIIQNTEGKFQADEYIMKMRKKKEAEHLASMNMNPEMISPDGYPQVRY